MAGVTLALYLVAFSIPSFLGGLYATPQLTWVTIVGSRLDVALANTAVIIALFALYYLGYRVLALNAQVPVWAVYLPPVTFALALMAIYPFGGWDLFLYISQGRLYTTHDLNPFLVTPQDAPSDPFFAYSSWWPHPSTYGPAWQMIASLVSLIGGSNLWLSILVFKVLVTVFFFASVVLVYLILRTHHPEARHLGAFLMAWNPLLLFEIAGNGHNDIVMVFFALLSIYLLTAKRLLWPLPLLTISVLVKYSFGLLVPGILVYLLVLKSSPRKKAVWLLGGLALSAVTVGLFVRPFGMAYSLLALFGLEELYLSSPATLLYLALQGNFPQYAATTIVKGVVVLMLGTLYVIELARFAREHRTLTLDSLLRFGFQAVFFLLLLLPRFHPWFVAWLLGIGVLMVDSEQTRRVLLLSFTAFLSHIVFYFIWSIYGEQLNYFTIEAMANALIFVPPLFYWFYSRARVRKLLLAQKERTIAVQEAEIGRLKALLSDSRKGLKTR